MKLIYRIGINFVTITFLLFAKIMDETMTTPIVNTHIQQQQKPYFMTYTVNKLNIIQTLKFSLSLMFLLSAIVWHPFNKATFYQTVCHVNHCF